VRLPRFELCDLQFTYDMRYLKKIVFDGAW